MEVLTIAFVAVISYVILYFVIKSAVRNGIIEARQRDNINGNSNQLPQKICPKCNKNHDFDYPKCPYCNTVEETI